jgi:uncharacterized membrane protein
MHISTGHVVTLRFAKMKPNLSFLFHFSWLSLALIAIAPTKAQSIPACRSITPSRDQVCYTEHPFSARQRDEGGTKTWNFIVERWAPNWVIVDYKVVREGGFGAVSEPTGSIVSSSGNAEIINVTNRLTTRLRETKTQLQAKLQGCYPPVCGQLQSQINTIDREIDQSSSYQRSAVSAGGNEKISFGYTTSVRCRSWLGVQDCGGGASINGKVLVYQRYLGDPSSLEQASLSLIEQSNAALKQLPKQVYFSNQCRFPVRLALHYRNQSDEWVTDGWWDIDGGKKTFLSTTNEQRITSNHSTFYFFAEILADPQKSITWAGDKEITFQDRSLRMLQQTLTVNSDGNYVLSIGCPNL